MRATDGHAGPADNPFLAPGDDRLFFATAEVTQRLNLLHHLIRYSDQVMVVTGPEGSGKTTLVDRLLREGQNGWRATVVEAHVETTGDRLLARALMGLDVQRDVITEQDGLDALRKHLAAADRGGLPTLVVVDDAHYLSAPVLKLLLRVARSSDYPGLRLLLVGDQSIADRTAAALGEALYHLVEMPPLSREQCLNYLHFRLDHADTPGHEHFDPAVATGLWKQSGGYPGPLNRLAAAVVDGARVPAPTPRARAGAPRATAAMAAPAGPARRGNRLVWVIAGAAVLVTVGITTLLHDAGDPEADLTQPLPPPEPVAPAARSAPPSPQPRNEQVAAAAPPATRAEEPPPAAEAEPEAKAEPAPAAEGDEEPAARPPTAPGPAPESRAATDPAADSEPDPAPEPAAEPDAEPEPESEPQTAPEPAPEPAVSPAAAPPPWPLGLPGERYVLQLMGSRERAPVAGLLTKHGLEEGAGVLELVHQGRPWFVLLYGEYADREAAIAAMRGLPKPLRELKPWARSVKSLRRVRPAE